MSSELLSSKFTDSTGQTWTPAIVRGQCYKCGVLLVDGALILRGKALPEPIPNGFEVANAKAKFQDIACTFCAKDAK